MGRKNFVEKATRLLKRLYQQELDIKVQPKPLRNRLGPYYKAGIVRARRRRDKLSAVEAVEDSGVVVLYRPC